MSTAIPKDVMALLDAATNDREYVTLHVKLPGSRSVPVNFQPTVSSTASIRTLKTVLGASDREATPMETIDRTLDVLSFMIALAASDADRELLRELDSRGFLDGNSLAAMLSTLMELVAGRPTTRSSSSAGGSLPDGPPSTAIADSTASIPSPLPSPAS